MGLFDKTIKTSEIYNGLRNQVFSLDPTQIKLETEQSNPIFGILMETGYKKAVVTLSAIGDGSVSLYFSNGGGIIGLGQHEEPRKACFSFLSFANQFLSHLQPTKEFPLPKKGYTSFYFLTNNGILTLTTKEKDLGKNRHPLSPLFYKGQEIITQARLINEKQKKDFQQLMHAVTTGDMHTLKKLIEDGVKPDISDPTGLTPLMVASHSGKVEILELLLNAGVPIDAKNSSGYTALMFSCNAGKLSCARFLIEKGANINEVDSKGSTSIMFCAQHGYNDIVRLLLEKGADPRVKGQHGLSAIAFAEQNGLAETKRILEDIDGT